ncbi:MAG TPA: DNA polymerase I [Stellaceae bacterium]|nr:DNA polymerase I [Stellaceae bacterium]
MSTPRHFYLVDGSGYIFRAFHALPPLTRQDGTPIGAVLGFSNMIYRLLKDTNADHIAIVFDAAETTFRNRIYDRYKANRSETPPELIPQFKLVREATDAFGLARIERADFEADDLIATYARAAAANGDDVTIVSSDKDLMQLVAPQIRMFDPIKNKPIGAAEVQEKFGVGPEKVVDVQALCGDSVDNVPGVPGIGVKTAAELINAYGDLETLLERAGEIKQPKRRQSLIEFAEQARLSKQLVRLDDHAPLSLTLDELQIPPRDTAKLTRFLELNEFRALLARVKNEDGGQPPETAPALPAPAVGPGKLIGVETRYELIQDLAALDRWIAEIIERGTVALDLETDVANNPRATLAGIALALIPGRACYIPLGHAGTLDASNQIPRDAALEKLKPVFADPSVLKIGHNIKFAIEALLRFGIAVAPIDDAMLMSYVLEGGRHDHALDKLAALHFQHDTVKYKELIGSGKAQIGFCACAIERARDYAAEAADMSLRLHTLLKPRLRHDKLLAFYETNERALPNVVAAMEQEGIRVDRRQLAELSEDFTKRLAELEREIYGLVGHPFNIGSPKQLGEVLFDELSLPGGKKNKLGAYGTDASILEELALTHDLPARVLDWRQFAKLKSTYADALVEEIDPETGRVHTTYWLAHTLTGRMSSNEPNLQNIPVRTEEGRKIRRAFVAEPGHVLISADYSQIELRLAAHMANVDALKQAFLEGADIHAATASEVFGVPRPQVGPDLRRRAKAINFGILYGMSAFGLAARIQVPQAEAAAYIKAYFERFPGIRDYMDRMKAACRDKGYVETLLGRRCHIPGIRDTNAMHRAYAEREAINAPLQGSAADIILRAMIRLPRAIADAGLRAKLLLQVHDELILEAPEDEAEATAELVKQVMEGAPLPVLELAVPLVVETGMAGNWDDAH